MDYDVLGDKDGGESGDGNNRNMLILNPVVSWEQQTDKVNLKYQEERKKIFVFDDKMMNLSKRFVNKANQLVQI